KKAGSTDPKKVAPALSGMEYQGSLGKVTMRATDHQMQHPMYVSVYTRSAKYDIEKSGVGWKTLVTLEPDEVMQPTSCKMGPF
ncbi:MAG: ABC transporter substrate-binding protein, partial [Rhodoferax sp.]|nr:ABC transporter substrate-binding protein [Rhodoferax sp.]